MKNLDNIHLKDVNITYIDTTTFKFKVKNTLFHRYQGMFGFIEYNVDSIELHESKINDFIERIFKEHKESIINKITKI